MGVKPRNGSGLRWEMAKSRRWLKVVAWTWYLDRIISPPVLPPSDLLVGVAVVDDILQPSAASLS
eukprot:2416851-Pyramimonas_sp.AAC.1